MLKSLTPILFLVAIFLSFQACNPDCVNLPTSNINLPPGPYQESSELAVTATPSSLIKGREFHLSLKNNNSTDISLLESRFEEVLNAAILKLPNEINSSATFLINDPDCTGNLIPIGTTSSLVGASFFVDNPFFVTPIPPLIVIPSPPPSIPPAVVNAWFSPNDRSYCIWFNPTMDTLQNGTIIEYPQLIPAGSPKGVGPKMGSVELAVGCSGFPPADDRLFHDNPVSGIVDKENNIIKIRIDRTSKNLGIEEYEGQFIDPGKMPDGTDYNIGGVCNPDGDQKPNIMYLVSLQTGRQLILFRGAD